MAVIRLDVLPAASIRIAYCYHLFHLYCVITFRLFLTVFFSLRFFPNFPCFYSFFLLCLDWNCQRFFALKIVKSGQNLSVLKMISSYFEFFINSIDVIQILKSLRWRFEKFFPWYLETCGPPRFSRFSNFCNSLQCLRIFWIFIKPSASNVW